MRRASYLTATVMLIAATAASRASAKMAMAPLPMATAFTPIAFVSPANFGTNLIEAAQRSKLIRQLCADIEVQYKKIGVRDEACGQVQWKADLRSGRGHPLIYAEFGQGSETTLLLGGVHPDELTPIPLAFRTARYLADNKSVLNSNVRVIIAPLVNPDGFLQKRLARTNENGIDLNRNFFTMDWYEKAKQLWQIRRGRLGSHFPGYFPNSEVETMFQIQLIDRFKPDKILSIHAPLGFLDYDGPGDGQPQNPSTTELAAKRLVTSISQKSRNYKVVDYNFYPGSLGNYAGNERHIPTVTLELETTEASKIDLYWKQFLPGIMQSVHYPFRSIPASDGQDGANASPFSSQYTPGQKKTI